MVKRNIICCLLVAALHFCCVADGATVRQPNAYNGKSVEIHYGHNGLIKYSLATGMLNVYCGGKAIFLDVYATTVYNGDTLISRNYPSKKITVTPVNNGLGKGKKYVIMLNGKGLPQMRQLFYVYPDKEYFLTAIEIAGRDLATNYLSPFTGKLGPVNDRQYTLFVPFDNDTFIRYGTMPLSKATAKNVSAEVNAVYDTASNRGVVAGSVEHGTWKTGVSFFSAGGKGNVRIWAGYSDAQVTRDSIAHGMVKGDVIASPKMMIGGFDDWRNGMETYGKVNRIADPPYIKPFHGATPVGWNSWGVLQDKLTYDKAIRVVDFFADSLKGFRSGGTAYIDLDAYWDMMVKGNDYHLLKQFSDYCKSKGLQPGIYWAPFTDWGFKGGANRKVEGSNYTYGQLWTKTGNGYHDLDGARALDPTHPGTLRRIDYFAHIFKDCGFKMIKIDFLGHGAVEGNSFYDTTVTTGMQAYRRGMEYLIRKLDGMFIYAAISPSVASGRYIHSRRIACDAFMTIDHTEYTLNSLTFGWWQTFLYNYMDADHVVLDHRSEGENRARMLSAIITGTWITGDDFSTHGPWSDRARTWYQNPELLKIVRNGKSFMPVSMPYKTDAANVFYRYIDGKCYLAVFNFSNAPQDFHISLKKLGVNVFRVTVKNALNNVVGNASGAIDVHFNGPDAVLYQIN